MCLVSGVGRLRVHLARAVMAESKLHGRLCDGACLGVRVRRSVSSQVERSCLASCLFPYVSPGIHYQADSRLENTLLPGLRLVAPAATGNWWINRTYTTNTGALQSDNAPKINGMLVNIFCSVIGEVRKSLFGFRLEMRGEWKRWCWVERVGEGCRVSTSLEAPRNRGTKIAPAN